MFLCNFLIKTRIYKFSNNNFIISTRSFQVGRLLSSNTGYGSFPESDVRVLSNPYHMVTPSPWPFFLSVALLGNITWVLGWFFFLSSFKAILVSFLVTTIVLGCWWYDTHYESIFEGQHTNAVSAGFRYGMVLFIVSEIFFFLAFFWAYLHNALNPSVFIGGVWPPFGLIAHRFQDVDVQIYLDVLDFWNDLMPASNDSAERIYLSLRSHETDDNVLNSIKNVSQSLSWNIDQFFPKKSRLTTSVSEHASKLFLAKELQGYSFAKIESLYGTDFARGGWKFLLEKYGFESLPLFSTEVRNFGPEELSFIIQNAMETFLHKNLESLFISGSDLDEFLVAYSILTVFKDFEDYFEQNANFIAFLIFCTTNVLNTPEFAFSEVQAVVDFIDDFDFGAEEIFYIFAVVEASSLQPYAEKILELFPSFTEFSLGYVEEDFLLSNLKATLFGSVPTYPTTEIELGRISFLETQLAEWANLAKNQKNLDFIFSLPTSYHVAESSLTPEQSSLNLYIQDVSLIQITGESTWNAYGIPFAMTLILVTSGVTLTAAHMAVCQPYSLLSRAIWPLGLTLLLAVFFLLIQGFEYVNLPISINDGIFGSVFFMATGFHGFHVFIGGLFLMVCFVRLQRGYLASDSHVSFECAIWYWHFVDVVWIFLFIIMYWWSQPDDVSHFLPLF